MKDLDTNLHRFPSAHFRGGRCSCQKHLPDGERQSLLIRRSLLITCSDLRLDAQGIGEGLFCHSCIIQNFGNTVRDEASIEMSLYEHNINDIIICGHSECDILDRLIEGAIQAYSPDLLGEIGARYSSIRAHYAGLTQGELLSVVVRENVLLQLERLSSIHTVSQRLKQGDLRIHGWLVDEGSGSLLTYDPDMGQFVPLAI